jgi:hypothetical protein
MVKTAGSFYAGYLKTVSKIAQTPDKIARATAEAIMTGSTSPFKDEIDKIVTGGWHRQLVAGVAKQQEVMCYSS